MLFWEELLLFNSEIDCSSSHCPSWISLIWCTFCIGCAAIRLPTPLMLYVLGFCSYLLENFGILIKLRLLLRLLVSVERQSKRFSESSISAVVAVSEVPLEYSLEVFGRSKIEPSWVAVNIGLDVVIWSSSELVVGRGLMRNDLLGLLVEWS